MIRLIAFVLLILLVSCKPSGEQKSKGIAESPAGQEAASSISTFEGPAAMLLQQLRDQGDYVNSRQFPSMVKPETVHAGLEGNNLIIDLRKADFYEKGHIKGSVNIPMDKVLAHFENDILPFKFDRIVLVCYSGHLSAYTTHLLRLMGYGNVYSMRWGMSGWNSVFAGEFWAKKISSEYQDQLVTESSPKPASVNQPVLQASATSGQELLRERVSGLLANGSKGIFIGTAEVFGNPGNYFIMNFERKDKYESGHIPGAIRYKQQGTLGIPSEMGTLPTDQSIVVYCSTGMTSAFAIAYLRLFGYDARSLSHGNNGFMHQKMLDEKEQLSWHPFTESVPNDFPFVSGYK